MLRRFHSQQRGDTIVEVLIAIAVVGSVLAITYSIMNRNLLTMRANQERTEATKLAQGQIEAIKGIWSLPADNALRIDLLDEPGGFCINPSGGVTPLSGSVVPASDFTTDDFSNYPAGTCVQQIFYHVGVVRQTGTYRVTVRWDRIGGGGRQEASLVYRLE